MRIAVIADIHGNLPALEAVLIDIARRHVDRTINLGDCVSGPLWPREVCDLLMASDDPIIRGNHDRWVSGPDLTSMGAADRYAYSQLNQKSSFLACSPTDFRQHRAWHSRLPRYADQRQSVSRRGGVGRPTCSSESDGDQGAIGCCAGPHSSVRTQPPRAFRPIARRPNDPESGQRWLPLLRRSRQRSSCVRIWLPPCTICCPRHPRGSGVRRYDRDHLRLEIGGCTG